MKGLTLLAHQAALLALPIPLLLRLALVMQLLALGQAELDLGDPALVEIYLEGNDSHALALNGAGELADLLAMQQQLARTRGCMTVAAGLHIFGDVGVDQVKLATL